MRWNLIKIRSCAIFRCFHRFDSFFTYCLVFIGRFMFSKESAQSLRFHCSTSCFKKKTLGSRGSFSLNDIDGSRREAPREKNNLGSQELGVDHISHQTGLELMCMFVCFHWRWQLGFDLTWLYVCDAWKKNCTKAYLERKVLLGKKEKTFCTQGIIRENAELRQQDKA